MSNPVEASRVQFDRRASCYGAGHILRDVSDVMEALEGYTAADLSPALDVATGAGHTAVCLAERGIDVTAAEVAAASTPAAVRSCLSRSSAAPTAPSAVALVPGGGGGGGGGAVATPTEPSEVGYRFCPEPSARSTCAT